LVSPIKGSIGWVNQGGLAWQTWAKVGLVIGRLCLGGIGLEVKPLQFLWGSLRGPLEGVLILNLFSIGKGLGIRDFTKQFLTGRGWVNWFTQFFSKLGLPGGLGVGNFNFREVGPPKKGGSLNFYFFRAKNFLGKRGGFFQLFENCGSWWPG